MRRVLGIDPGTYRTGFGVVEERGNRLHPVAFGTHRAPAGSPLPDRLRVLHAAVLATIDLHAPEALAVEDVFFGKSYAAAIRIGEGRAIALLAAAERGIPAFEYAPALVKRSVATNGLAPKSQVAAMVRTILGLKERDGELEPDAADALAIAITHLHRAKWAWAQARTSSRPRSRSRSRRARPAGTGPPIGADRPPG